MNAPQTLFTGTQPVSPANAFDEAALARWMQAHVPGFSGTMAVAQFKGGQSNPTFRLTTPSRPSPKGPSTRPRLPSC